MCEVYCQSMQSEEEFSNLTKGGKHFTYINWNLCAFKNTDLF